MSSKILFISHQFAPDIGGIEVNSEILAQAYSTSGFDVHVLTWSVGQTHKKFNFSVIRNPSIWQLIKEHNWADIIFENNPSLRLSWPVFFFNKPSIIVLHTWVARTNGKIHWQDKIKNIWLKRASKVIACSNAVKNIVWPAAIVISNPYQENIFKNLPAIHRTNDFVFLGRLVSDKGLNIAIQAFSKLLIELKGNSHFSKLHFTIIGNGPEREILEKEVLELGLQHQITFVGSLIGDKLVSMLNMHKFILVPSTWQEPFGMVALEGMACGCIPIVSDGGGLQEAIGNAGITFVNGNVDKLYLAMLNIIENETMQQQLLKAAVGHLKQHRSAEVSKRYIQLIDEVLKN